MAALVAALREQWERECFFIGRYTGEPIAQRPCYTDFPDWLEARGETLALAWWREHQEHAAA